MAGDYSIPHVERGEYITQSGMRIQLETRIEYFYALDPYVGSDTINTTREARKVMQALYFDRVINSIDYSLGVEKARFEPHFDYCKGAIHIDNSPRIKNLNGLPEYIAGEVNCRNQNLTSLDTTAKAIDGNLNVQNNNLTTYEGCCTKIGSTLNLYNNPISSLKEIGTYFKDGYIGNINLPTSIESHLLGLLQIPRLKFVSCYDTNFSEVTNQKLLTALGIINKYLDRNRDIWKCQDELQDLDLDDYAQL